MDIARSLALFGVAAVAEIGVASDLRHPRARDVWSRADCLQAKPATLRLASAITVLEASEELRRWS
jgi:hypothetical protein